MVSLSELASASLHLVYAMVLIFEILLALVQNAAIKLNSLRQK